jgi:hypothetical protein
LEPLKKQFWFIKIFFQTLGQKLRLCPFSGEGGCKRWYFGQISAPATTPLRAAAPLAPPCYGPAETIVNEQTFQRLIEAQLKKFLFISSYPMFFAIQQLRGIVPGEIGQKPDRMSSDQTFKGSQSNSRSGFLISRMTRSAFNLNSSMTVSTF